MRIQLKRRLSANVIWILAMIVSPCAYAVVALPLLGECEQTITGIKKCQLAEMTVLDERLSRLEVEIVKLAADVDRHKVQPAGLVDAFNAAQEAWHVYRKQESSFAYDRSAPGSEAGIWYNARYIELSKLRVQELEQLTREWRDEGYGKSLTSDEQGHADKKMYPIWLWVDTADLTPEIYPGAVEGEESEIFEHPCGYVREAEVERLPPPGYPGFVDGAETVLELNQQGEVISRWAMPVDSWVMGVSGDRIIASYRKQNSGEDYELMGLEISTGGELQLRGEVESSLRNTECPSTTEEAFGTSAYLRCAEFNDLQSGEKRVLAYEGVCT